MYSLEDYRESARYITERLNGRVPRILLILGTGLGFLAEKTEDAVIIPYKDIPHFKSSTAPGHTGRFVIGSLCGVSVMIMQGRLHCYEGWSSEDAAYQVRTARLCGAETMIVTNAAGAVNEDYKVGDFMIISDHIRLMGVSPLTGPNIDEFGPRFCDMSETYDKKYRSIAIKSAEKLGIRAHEGVYFYFAGPQYETPAEIRAARLLGGDAVGMSTVFEATAASHCGMKVLGISLMTNMAAGILKNRLDGAEVEKTAEKQKDGFAALIMDILKNIG